MVVPGFSDLLAKELPTTDAHRKATAEKVKESFLESLALPTLSA